MFNCTHTQQQHNGFTVNTAGKRPLLNSDWWKLIEKHKRAKLGIKRQSSPFADSIKGLVFNVEQRRTRIVDNFEIIIIKKKEKKQVVLQKKKKKFFEKNLNNLQEFYFSVKQKIAEDFRVIVKNLFAFEFKAIN